MESRKSSPSKVVADDDTDVVELSQHDIVATEIVAVNDPAHPPVPPPRTSRMPDLPPPRTLQMRPTAPRHGNTKPGMGTMMLGPDNMDEDTFSGRDTATYQKVSVEPVAPIDPRVVAKTILIAPQPPPTTERIPAPRPAGPANLGRTIVMPGSPSITEAAPPTSPSAVPGNPGTAPTTQTSATPPAPRVELVAPPQVSSMPVASPSQTDLPLYADEVIPAPFSAPRTEASPGNQKKRSATTAILGATLGVLVVVGGFFSPRVYRWVVAQRNVGAVPTGAPSDAATTAPNTEPSVLAEGAEVVASAPATAVPSSASAPVAASASAPSVASAAVASSSPPVSSDPPPAPGGSICAEDRGLPAEICAYVDGIRAGGDPPRPALATFQRFLLARDITRIRGRVLSQKEAGTYAITLSGSFGYCLETTRPLDVGALYIGWAARRPADATCSRFRALAFPDTIDRLFAAADPVERRRLADALAGELPGELAAP